MDRNHGVKFIARWKNLLVQEVTQERLAFICRLVFFASLIPLIVIALYNYPADDDFGFTLPAATAWLQTHSIIEVIRAILVKTHDIYMGWQGDFISTLFFQLNPLIFNIKLYFLSNWYILGLLCLSVGYLLKSVTNEVLHVSRSVFWIVYTLIMMLVLQFMPSIAESIYWFNGGQYTVAACYLMLMLGLLIRSTQPSGKWRNAIRLALVAICAFILGGSFYGPALASFVILFEITFICWLKRSKTKWHASLALLSFCIAFGISIIAPGNAVRQSVVGQGQPTGAIQAVLNSVLDSMDLTGKWLSPQLFAALMVIIPVMWKPLKDSKYSFPHPISVLIMMYAMYASSLTPGIYSGYGYMSVRYLNVIYFLFLMTVFCAAIYAEGRFIRWLEGRKNSEASRHLLQAAEGIGRRFFVLYLIVCIAFFTVGGFSTVMMNRPTVSATKVLISGEAAKYYQEMQERQEYIRVTDSDSVAVKTLSVDIPVFKHDSLPFQGIYGRVRYMKWYFERFYNAQ